MNWPLQTILSVTRLIVTGEAPAAAFIASKYSELPTMGKTYPEFLPHRNLTRVSRFLIIYIIVNRGELTNYVYIDI